jgi:small subunit ribosomal protein S20
VANHKSAAKRARQSLKKMEQNKVRKSEVKTAEKNLRTALLEKDKDKAAELFPKIQSLLQRLAKSGITKKNNASRKTSRLADQLAKL